MPTLDEQIAQSLLASQQNGELQSAASWGKPLDLADGYAQTPEELRMGYKALKDAGFVPPEVETMQQIAALGQAIEANPESPDAARLRQRAAELQQHLALRLEKLSRSGTL
jgi:Domain of unknown function (DUF1992)